MKHRLSSQNPETMTATCSVCGPGVRIQKKAKGAFACRTARRLARAAYRKAHPVRVATAKAATGRSAHKLTGVVCAECGPVVPQRQGRGLMCPNRAAELGWETGSEASAQRCPTCATWLTVAGLCKECDDRTRWDVGYGLMLLEHGSRGRPDPAWVQDGLHMMSEQPLPRKRESAVSGWKILGSDDPNPLVAIRPEYAALYGGSK